MTVDGVTRACSETGSASEGVTREPATSARPKRKRSATLILQEKALIAITPFLCHLRQVDSLTNQTSQSPYRKGRKDRPQSSPRKSSGPICIVGKPTLLLFFRRAHWIADKMQYLPPRRPRVVPYERENAGSAYFPHQPASTNQDWPALTVPAIKQGGAGSGRFAAGPIISDKAYRKQFRG